MNHKNLPAPFPDLGFGLGLRPQHYSHIFEHEPQVDWFEVISENFMDTDGRPKRNLARIKERYPVVMHGVALSIGTIDPLNSDYLKKLKALMNWLNPVWVSDHLCWTGVAHKNSHDLLPVPYTEEALKHIISRIQQVQNYLGRAIALENPSTYLEFKTSHIPEAEFIARMVQESGCYLLLDVNNVYVSCYNHRLNAKAYIDGLPIDRIVQIHLSGHENKGTHIIDTHDAHVVDEVWALYRYVVHKAGRIPNTMVEWDDQIPAWEVLHAELDKAKAAARQAAHYLPLPELYSENQPPVENISTALTTLYETQSLLQNAILQGAKIDSQPAQWIRAKVGFAPADQLAVYVTAYRYRLYDVIQEDYPVLKFFLGEPAFHHLITDFVNNIHSDHFNIGRYALKLPAFLAGHAAYSAFALELCTLETSISQLTDPPETTPLQSSDIVGMNAETLMEAVLTPRTALQLLAFAYPINRYYVAWQENNPLPAPLPEKSFLAVFRHDDVVWRMPLDKTEYYLLQKLFSGVAIGAALENIQTELDLNEEALLPQLSEWFARWLRNGLLGKNKETPLLT